MGQPDGVNPRDRRNIVFLKIKISVINILFINKQEHPMIEPASQTPRRKPL
jgi:hypothetical protein